jgi:integrase
MAKRGNNEGSIHQLPSGTWRAQASLEGKRVSFTSKSKRDCQEWLRRTLGQIDQGLRFAGTQMTVGEYVTYWYENSKLTWQWITGAQYQQIIRDYIIPGIGNIKLKNLVPDIVDRFYIKLSEQGKSPRTIHIVHSIFHRSLEEACRKRFILYNPAHGAILPKRPLKEMNILEEPQISQFLIAAQTSRYETLYYLAITTGMRQGELLGLKWSDVNWFRGTILVQRQAKRETGKGIILRQLKTHASLRTVKIGEGALQALRRQKEYVQFLKEDASQHWHENSLVFPSPTGNPLDQSNVLKDYYATLERTGLPRIRFHDLRHTAASMMLNHNVPLMVISKMLGHSRPSTTLDIYGHLYIPMMDEAAALMDQLVTPVPVSFSETNAESSLP